MKSTITLFCFISVFVSIKSEDSCDPWPENLKTVELCCDLPQHNPIPEEQICDRKCMKDNQESTINDTCMNECFITSQIFTKDKKIDKSVLTQPYGVMLSNNIPGWNPVWAKSVELCEFESTGNLNNDLAKFIHCTRTYLLKNCIVFKLHDPECYLVEEHFMKCNKIEVNCSQVLTEEEDRDCCSAKPELIKFQTIKDCSDKCLETEYFRIMIKKCVFDCLIKVTKIMADNKFDFEVAKTLLTESANMSVEWDKPIEDTITKCQKKLIGSSFNFFIIAKWLEL